MMRGLACVFPGQGSQYVGMGRIQHRAFSLVRQTFDQASEALGFDLASLCFEGPEETLTETLNAQPAILTLSVALWRVMQENVLDAPHPLFLAGHSLGEYSALVAAGALEFSDGLRLVRRRGELMQAAGRERPGGMAAVIGLDAAAVEEVCERVRAQARGVVGIANYNSPRQIVISGDHVPLERAVSLMGEEGARRVIPLPVSVAGHSSIMGPIGQAFGEALEEVPIQWARTPVVANVSARPIESPKQIRGELIAQLTSPVQWVGSVQYLIAQGVDTFVEVGPGDVLRRLVGSIGGEVSRRGVEDMIEGLR